MLSKYRDEIYGVSILWIMLFHGYLCDVYYFADVPILNYVGKLIEAGNLGVEMFLMMSGICLYFSYSKNPDTFAFLKKRLKRVIPAMFVICGPYWIWQIIRGDITFSLFFLNLTTLRFWVTGDQQIWFVSLILLCYLLFPYFYGYIYEKEEHTLFRCVLSCICLVLFVWIIKDVTPKYYKQTEIALTRIPSFLIGIWMGKKVHNKEKISALWWIPLCGAFLLYFIGVIEAGLVPSGMLHRYLGLLLAIPMTFFIAQCSSWLPESFRKVLRFFGGISLELYFAHILFKRLYQGGYWFFEYQQGDVLRWMAVLVISILVAKVASILVSRAKDFL